MGIALLDANVLIALAWPDHESHDHVGRWFARHSRSGWATCPFTQSAFVRTLSNPAFSPHALSLQNALVVLQSNLSLPGHHFWAASISLTEAVDKIGKRLTGHRQVTDTYLLGLAMHHKGRLATMDRGIASLDPGGFVELIE